LRPYFQNQTVASAIYGFNTEVKYDINSANVYNNLKGIFMKPEANRVEYLLSKGIPVLLYNGQDNLIVPSLGAMKWVDNLNHNSAQEFNKQMFGVWKIGDKIVGAIKSAGNLEMRIIFNAGHIIGKDKPL
jgi:carboxypeptidase C (cathepsin A)